MARKRGRISMASVEALAAGDEMRDSQLSGFGVRRQQAEASYFVHRRLRGVLTRITIGRHGSPWTPETARREAARMVTLMLRGEDPRVERKAIAADDRRMAQLAEDFERVYGPKLKASSLVAYRSIIRVNIIPALGRLRVQGIERSDVERAHARWKDTPRTANHALAVLSRILSWAEEQGYRERNTNPCAGIKRYKERRRQRYLSSVEVGRVGAALESLEAAGKLNAYAAAALRLLVYTGARVGEVLKLKWSEVDLERGLLILEDSKTGQKTIMLNGPAAELLESIGKMEGNPFVFVGAKDKRPLATLTDQWVQVRTLARLEDVRLHDLRHSFASVAVGAGGSLPVLGKALGHRQPQTTARYAHLDDDPVRELVTTTGGRLKAALEGKVRNGNWGSHIRRVEPKKKNAAVK